MPGRMYKTATDVHWDQRAASENDRRKVNIADLVQRGLENDFILGWVKRTDRVLEVGCGNGYLTETLRQQTAHVTGFDFAERMIAEAVRDVGETNNRFFVGSVLASDTVLEQYDAVVCVRVLINLADVEEQKQAIRNMARWTRASGRLILVEGYRDGFAGLNGLRQRCGMPPLYPAPINFYSAFSELWPTIDELYDVAGEWHSGFYDVLTRIVYPLLVGPEQATGPGEFHERIAPLVKMLNPAELAPYARLRGLALTRRPDQ